MKVSASFLHLEHTPALDEKISEVSQKLEKILENKGTIKWFCTVKNGIHFAEINLKSQNCDYHSKAHSENLYHSIDLAILKIEKQILKKKDKYNKIHRSNPELIILDIENAWTDRQDLDESNSQLRKKVS